jgi:hypothetical protein
LQPILSLDRSLCRFFKKNVATGARQNPPRVVGALVIQLDGGGPAIFDLLISSLATHATPCRKASEAGDLRGVSCYEL